MAPVVSHVYAKCSSVQMTWKLPPVEVVCTRNFHYILKIKSSEVGWAYKGRIEIGNGLFKWQLQRNKSYSVQLTAFDLTGKRVGLPWQQNITITPSGMK